MHRLSMRSALVLVAAASLTLAACGSKAADSNSSTTSAAPAASGSTAASGSAASSGSGTAAASGGALAIVPLVNVDQNAIEVQAADDSKAAKPAGDGKAKCSGITIAMAGALTGSASALGLNILGGAKLALDEHNKANPNCQVTLKQFDTEGDAQKATQVAPQIVGDNSIIGLLGPAFSGETNATGPIFFQAGLLSATSSATKVDLTTNGWTNFFRGLGNDQTQGGAGANYMTKTMGLKKICVVSDDSPYGVGLAEVVTTTLGSAADSNCTAKVKTGDKDFSATVQLVKGEQPDAVYYAGYYPEAAPFVAQLRDGGVTAAFVSGDGTKDNQFIKQAGEASKGAILTCPCGPAPAAMATDYKAVVGADPGTYSVEGYDLTTIMLKGIDSGITTRAALIDYFKNYDGVGLGKTYKWNSTGELAVTNPWIYEVK